MIDDSGRMQKKLANLLKKFPGNHSKPDVAKPTSTPEQGPERVPSPEVSVRVKREQQGHQGNKGGARYPRSLKKNRRAAKSASSGNRSAIRQPSRPAPPAVAPAPAVKREPPAPIRIKPGRAIPLSGTDWQAWGRELALKASRPGPASCRIGLDFGTAFTKACVRYRERTVLPVAWDLAVNTDDALLLPGAMTEHADGSCELGAADRGRLHEDLKMRLLRFEDDFDRSPIVAYLALVTRYIRGWLFTRHAAIVEGFNLRWSLNIGLPTAPWENRVLKDEYCALALAGWNLGVTDGPVTLDGARSSLMALTEDGREGFGLRRADIAATPEFVAQIASYVNSPRRRDDLHALVDVGAGTVDIVTFNVWTDREASENVFPIFAASVERKGTHVLLAHRVAGGHCAVRDWCDDEARLDAPSVSRIAGCQEEDVLLADRHFRNGLGESIADLLHSTRKYRYPLSPAWRTGIPVLLCGGGRALEVYRSAVEFGVNQKRLIRIEMPVPDELQGSDVRSDSFHRISVAYGLSIDPLNLGNIRNGSMVPDVEIDRPRDIISDRYISKDAV